MIPVELMICYSIVISLSLILKIMKRSDKFHELRNKIKGLKNTVEDSIKTDSIDELNSVISEFNEIHTRLLMDENILFEMPE
jgi:hypothetical protein